MKYYMMKNVFRILGSLIPMCSFTIQDAMTQVMSKNTLFYEIRFVINDTISKNKQKSYLSISADDENIYTYTLIETENNNLYDTNRLKIPEPERSFGKNGKNNLIFHPSEIKMKSNNKLIPEFAYQLRHSVHLSAVYGRSFNPLVFAGMGVSIDFFLQDYSVLIPLYLNVRVSLLNRRVSPVIINDMGFVMGFLSKNGFSFGPHVAWGIGIKYLANSSIAFSIAPILENSWWLIGDGDEGNILTTTLGLRTSLYF
jgi:hypothetical protein